MSLKYSILALALCISGTAKSQDYPYDEEPPSALQNETSQPVAENPEGTRESKLPVEGTGTKTVAPRRPRVNSLFRFAAKAGANFAFLNSDSAGDFSGMGIEGLVAFGWDLAYQPVFIELETGYRSHFMGDNTLHIIPFRFGVFYRNRIGKTELWKPGIATSVDARIEDGDFALIPAFHLSSQFEFTNFLLEPVVSLYRIGAGVNSAAFALRVGFRF